VAALIADVIQLHESALASGAAVSITRRVIEGGGGARLLLEATHPVLVSSQFRGQQLDSDLALEASVFGEITSPIPPLPIGPTIS
jgi:hypothetical protein